MKKMILILAIIAFMFTSCTQNNIIPGLDTSKVQESTMNIQTTSNIIEAKVSEYFPIIKDTHMKYKGTGNEYAGYETYVDYVKDDTMQIRSMNGGTTSVRVYRLEDGMLKKTFMQGEVYCRYDFTSLTNQDEIMIKEPIKDGTSWTLSDGSTRSITAVDKQIKTPAGDYKALEITTKRKDSTQRDYYVKEIGLAKTEFISGNDSDAITSEIEKIEKNVPYKQRIRFYFPEFQKDRIVYMDRDVEILTNEDINKKLQEELKKIPDNSGLSKVLTTGTKVLGSKIDEKNGTVTVDFSSELIKEMNAGTSFESMLIKCITNTFGEYYGKEKVIITTEGKLYESGHIILNPGDYFTVDKENVTEYK